MPDLWMDVDTALASVPVNKIPLVDDTDFKSIEDAVVFNQAGLALFWNFTTTAGVTTVTAVTPTSAGDYDWTDFTTSGMYGIEIPASAGASINNDAEGVGYFTGVATGILPWRGPSIGFRDAALNNLLIDDALSVTRGLAGTALPAVAADGVGGLPISDAGGLDLDTKLANTNEITAARMGALTDWLNGGRLDLLLDAIPTTAMRGTDGVDTATMRGTDGALTDKAGFSLSATGLDLIASTATGMVEIAKAIWDRVLTGATHNIATSAGRRLRALNDFGQYEGGLVWIDTANGTAGTVDFENGTVNRPSLTLADASTIRASIPLPGFHIVPGSAITLASTYNNVEFQGVGYTLALGGQDINNSHISNAASIAGIATAANAMSFYDSIFGNASIQRATSNRCAYTGTVEMTLAGAYRYYDCKSGVAGAGSPTFTKTAGQTITAEWRNWSNGITVSGLESGDVVTISGRLGTVTLNGADANVEIRGTYKSLVNNLTGSPTVNTEGAINAAQLVDDVWDEIMASHNVGGSAGKFLRQIKEGVVSAESTVNDAAATTTSFITALTEASDSHYSDATMAFISGALTGQARIIENYTGTTKEVTFDEAWSEAPADTDSFIILTTHSHTLIQVVAAILDELLSEHTTAGSLGKAVSDILADTGTDGVVISTTTANQIADAILKRDWTEVSGEAARSALNALRFLRNKWSIAGTTLTVTEEDDTTPAWTAEISTDAAAEPVTGSDPA